MFTIEISQKADGSFIIKEFNEESILPHTEKKTAYETVARVAQIMGLKEPIKPQNWPEKICIGEIETELI